MRVLGVLLVTSMVAILGWSLVGTGDDADAAPTRSTALTLEGRGYGHGRGLSQYGAQGAASVHGKTYRQILRFYYPGTRVETLRGRLRVLITANPSERIVVIDRTGLRVRRVGTDRSWPLREPGAKRWRLRAAPDGATEVAVRTDRWRTVRTVRGEAEFVAAGPLRLITGAGARRYAGALRSAVSNGRRVTVNVVGMEAYLRGVVPREVPALWHPQAVRAQSVAARTYAAFERAARAQATYHLCDTTACQVYGGLDEAHPASDRAIEATADEVLTWRDAPAFTQFSSSNGGWSVRGDVPYLSGQKDPWDRWSGNPNRSWTVTVPAARIEAAYPSIGRFARVAVPRRDGNGAWGGRALQVKVIGTAGSVSVSGEQFRFALGLRSSWFRPV